MLSNLVQVEKKNQSNSILASVSMSTEMRVLELYSFSEKVVSVYLYFSFFFHLVKNTSFVHTNQPWRRSEVFQSAAFPPDGSPMSSLIVPLRVTTIRETHSKGFFFFSLLLQRNSHYPSYGEFSASLRCYDNLRLTRVRQL